MFDNNNQNFNNDPFYNNDINNIGNESNSNNNNYEVPIFQNNNVGYVPPMFNSDINNNIGNEFNSYNNSMSQNTNDNYIAPIFNNVSNNVNNPFDFNQTNNGFVPSTYDEPPVLDEIKDLNSSPINSAPTLDVLGPMNIMPESLTAPKTDILDAYDNGNMLNSSMPGLESNQFNNMNNNMLGNQNNFMPNNFFEQPNIENNMFEQPNLSNNSFVNNSNMDFSFNQNNINGNFNSDLNYNMPLESNNNFNMESISNNFSPNINSQDNNDFVTNNQDNTNLLSNNIINQTEVSQNDISNNLVIPENKNNFDIPLTTEENNETTSLNSKINYDIIQDKSLQEIKEEETDLLSLGLDDSYSEPDMLEIMDIESEQLDDSNNEETDETPSVLDNVDKIKKLVEELKNNGVDIQLEEFDFESMYQLIIKLNK